MTTIISLRALRPAPTRCLSACALTLTLNTKHTITKTALLNSLSRRSHSSLLTLAIETSCDDTCVAVLEKYGPSARLLFNKKITSDNTAFGGVHPAVAIISHTTNLPSLVQEAVKLGLPVHGKNRTMRLPDFISVTRGPGMSTNLAVGLDLAKGLAIAWKRPLLAVHHMQAHALTPRLVTALQTPPPSSSQDQQQQQQQQQQPPQSSPNFPFLTLLISGGHTQLVLSSSLTSHRILANCSPVAIGNLLDRAAKLILPPSLLSTLTTVSFGPALEAFAFPDSLTPASPDSSYNYTPPPTRRDEITPYTSHTRGWSLTAPLASRRAMEFCFSGLFSQIQKLVNARKGGIPLDERRELARACMKLAFEHLASRIVFALADPEDKRKGHAAKKFGKGKDEEEGRIKTLVLSGGVASNKFLRHVVRRVLDVRGYEDVEIVAPPVELCTDNAAMIAWTGIEMWEAGYESRLDCTAVGKWSVDERAPDGGILGVDRCNFVRREGFESTEEGVEPPVEASV